MTTPIKILHITPHLGGGVGRVLTQIVKHSLETQSNYEHTVVCLENPIKRQPEIINNRINFIIRPLNTYLKELIEDSDIIQLEWWNHPTTIKYLSNLPPLPIRLLTWYHNSGINNNIPKQLILNSHTFLFTTDASLNIQEIKNLIPENKNHLGVVYASGGFDDFPHPRNREKEGISIGYFGSLKLSKIHSDYSLYLSTLPPNTDVRIIGDLSSTENVNVMKALIESNIKLKSKVHLTFTGYVEDPIIELDKINVLAYLLNPNHYGTTENSLLQAMSMGIVPIVLNNPAERRLIDDYETGFIVTNPEEFAEAVQWLHENPIARQIMGEKAAKYIRERFSIENTTNQLNTYYDKIMTAKKEPIKFKKILPQL